MLPDFPTYSQEIPSERRRGVVVFRFLLRNFVPLQGLKILDWVLFSRGELIQMIPCNIFNFFRDSEENS